MNSNESLAAAIRRGATLRPQATNGDCYEDASLLEPFASCSIGAAVEAMYGPYRDIREVPNWDEAADYLYDSFPCVAEPAPACPDLTCSPNVSSVHMFFDSRDCLQDLINHLNDEHKWSREQVADFIDTLARTDRRTPTPIERH